MRTRSLLSMTAGAVLLLGLSACGDDGAPGVVADDSASTTSTPASTATSPSEPASDETSDETPDESQSPAEETSSTPNPTEAPSPSPAESPKLIGYAGGESPGVTVQSRADARKLNGAPASFKRFVGDLAEKLKAETSCDDAAVGVTVQTLRTDGYADGAVNDCGGYRALWAIVDGRWKEIEGTQDTWDCAVLKRYTVPSDVVGDSCYAYHGDHEEHPYHQA